MRLTQSILKRKFPSVHKPLRILGPPKISPSKRAFGKYKPGACFRNFTACRLSPIHLSYALYQGHVACQDFTLTGTNCSRDVLSWNQQKNCTLYTSSPFCPFKAPLPMLVLIPAFFQMYFIMAPDCARTFPSGVTRNGI